MQNMTQQCLLITGLVVAMWPLSAQADLGTGVLLGAEEVLAGAGQVNHKPIPPLPISRTIS